MPSDDLIPSFLSLQPQSKRARSTAPRDKPAAASRTRAPALPQLSFDLSPVPVVASVPPAPVREPPTEPRREPVVYTVRQLIAELRENLEGIYTGLLTVEGEISNCRAASSGHRYFTLKDGDAQLPVVLFRRHAEVLGLKLRDGMAVEVRGRISVYESRGQLQLIGETLRPLGEGALQLAFEQLKRRLKAEGLFDRPRRPLPPFPRCIGIVTSPQGAALRDIISVVRRRHARLNLLVFPAVVQGPACPGSIAAGVRWFNRNHGRADLILITRGGGSLEDLAGFNDETLARAIAASTLPVVSAVGHEIDYTIADFVADLRAPTPSAAAEMITAAQHRIEERVASLQRRLFRGAEFTVLRTRRRLERLSAEQVLRRLRDNIGRREQRIDELQFRLRAAADRRLRNRAGRLALLETRLRRHDPTLRMSLSNRRLAEAQARLQRLGAELTARREVRLRQAAGRLHALSPLAVLNRGYSILYVEGDTPHILRDSREAQPGMPIRARLAHGSARATITEILTETPTQ